MGKKFNFTYQLTIYIHVYKKWDKSLKNVLKINSYSIHVILKYCLHIDKILIAIL